MSDSKNSRRPVRMTEPLKLSELSQTELTYLWEMNAVIRGISDRIGRTSDKARPPSLWGTVEGERSNNVLFIDGARGHGKTSLFLTLLDGWSRSRKRQGEQPDELETEAGFVDTGQEIGCRVRFLDILDFDPMPTGMSVHAWLTGAWEKAARAADEQGAASLGSWTCDDREGCYELWHDVMRRAIIAWSPPVGATHIATQALDRKEQLQSWSTLRDDWQKMVTRIVNQLVSGKKLRDDTVIVVPIDDVDLQVERIAELLPALRLFNHPRVVYLLTGHVQHLEEMLRLDLHGRQLDLAKGRKQKCVNHCEWATTLSRAAVDKTIPASQRWRMEKPTLSDALKVLYRVEGVERGLERLIGAQLAGLINNAPGTPALVIRPLSYRALQRLSESLEIIRRKKRKKGDGPEEDLGKAALAGLIGVWSPDDGVDHAPTRQPLRPRIDGHLLANGLIYLSLKEGDVNVCFSAEVEFWFRPSLGEVSHNSDQSVLSQVLFSRSPEVVAAGGIDWDANAVLAWTEVKAKSLTGLFVWPWAKNPDANELVERGRQWQEVLDASSGANDKIAFLAYAWVRMQKTWTEGDDESPAGWVKRFDSKDDGVEAWRTLLEELITEQLFDLNGQDALPTPPPYLHDWYRERLPAMAAPEFGLPREVQEAILKAFEDHILKPFGTSDSLAEVLNRNRRAWMGDALYREAAYRDPKTQPRHTTEQEEQLLRGIDDRAHGAPWYKYIEAQSRSASNGASASADELQRPAEE